VQVVVCVKLVPSPGQWSQITFRKNGVLQREGIDQVINPLDKHALEEAVRIRQKHGGTVTVLTMGPLSGLENLREALAMGADRAFLLSDRCFAGADTLATSCALAAGIKKAAPDFDLVLCGAKSLDSGTAQVGPQLAVHLEVAHVTSVFSVDLLEESTFQVKMEMERGYLLLNVLPPVVMTVTHRLNKPCIPTLADIVAAGGKEITVYSLAELGLSPSQVGQAGSPTQVRDLFFSPVKRLGKILEGSLDEKVEKLLGQPGVAGVLG